MNIHKILKINLSQANEYFLDDIFDDPVNISNSSSLGVPLNCSTSSEECQAQDDAFAIPGFFFFTLLYFENFIVNKF